VEEAVDAAEVHEGAVLGDVLDDAADDHALLQVLEGAGLELVALTLEKHAPAEDDVAALLVELDDLELVGLADELIEVADRAQIDLRAREERLHATLDGDAQPPLHPRGDGALDQLVPLAGGADLVPHLQLVGLLLGEEHQAVVGLLALDEHVHPVARGHDRLAAARVGELAERDHPLGLVADVDDDRVLGQADDGPGDDISFAERIRVRHGRLEQRGEALAASAGRGLGLYCHGKEVPFCDAPLRIDRGGRGDIGGGVRRLGWGSRGRVKKPGGEPEPGRQSRTGCSPRSEERRVPETDPRGRNESGEPEDARGPPPSGATR
jgi:hypothetical protein